MEKLSKNIENFLARASYNLYLIQYTEDGRDEKDCVEALSIKDAIEVWEIWRKELQGLPREPDSCTLICDASVFRRSDLVKEE